MNGLHSPLKVFSSWRRLARDSWIFLCSFEFSNEMIEMIYNLNAFVFNFTVSYRTCVKVYFVIRFVLCVG